MMASMSEKFTFRRPRGHEYDVLAKTRGWTADYRAWRECIDDMQEARFAMSGTALECALDAAELKYALATNGRCPVFSID